MIQRIRQPRQLGPADQGSQMSYDEFMASGFEDGYRYELIDGELIVSPAPNLGHMLVLLWLHKALDSFADAHPKVINLVGFNGRVFIPERERPTVPEPDLVAYRDFPEDLADEEMDWRAFNPILVAEVLSPDTAPKDLVRNVGLYFGLPSIKEYWILDPRRSTRRPMLTVHRRYGKRWKVTEIAPGGTYTTKLLPGFELIVDRDK